MTQLDEIRQAIGHCDDAIIQALEKRMSLIEDVIAYKKEKGVPIFQPEVEEKCRLDLMAKLVHNPYQEEIEGIFETVVDKSKTIQGKKLIAGNVMLVGFMGAGKSTVSGYLSEMLAMNRVEMDEIIAKKEGMSIPEIFEKNGEAYFRNCETNLLIQLQKQNQQVVSCGGGVVMRPENVEHMKKSGIIVLLTASPETIYDRVKDSDERPLLRGHMNIPYIKELMEARRPKYEAAADVVINTDGKDARTICEELIAAQWGTH